MTDDEIREPGNCSSRSDARHRPQSGRLLAQDDPRLFAATKAMRCLGTFDWRDVAEIVNAVLEADDAMAAAS